MVKIWEIFRYGTGCMAMAMTLCFGLAAGYLLRLFEEQGAPYIDQETAIQYGLENARGLCRDIRHPHPVDCIHFTLTNIREDNAGWFLQFTSADNRRVHSMLIKRKGEYDSTGYSDLDYPQ